MKRNPLRPYGPSRRKPNSASTSECPVAKYSSSSASTAVSRQKVPSSVRSSITSSPAGPPRSARGRSGRRTGTHPPRRPCPRRMPTRLASSVTVSSSRSSRSRATPQRPSSSGCASCSSSSSSSSSMPMRACARVTSRSTAGLSKERRSNSGSYARFTCARAASTFAFSSAAYATRASRGSSASSASRSSTSSSTASRPPTVSPNTPTASASSISTSEASVPAGSKTWISTGFVWPMRSRRPMRCSTVRGAPRQVVVHQVVGELEVAALAAHLGAQQHLGALGVAEARHLPVPLHQRQVAVVAERLDALAAQLRLQRLQRVAALGEHEHLGAGLRGPDAAQHAEERHQLRVPRGQLQVRALAARGWRSRRPRRRRGWTPAGAARWPAERHAGGLRQRGQGRVARLQLLGRTAAPGGGAGAGWRSRRRPRAGCAPAGRTGCTSPRGAPAARPGPSAPGASRPRGSAGPAPSRPWPGCHCPPAARARRWTAPPAAPAAPRSPSPWARWPRR